MDENQQVDIPEPQGLEEPTSEQPETEETQVDEQPEEATEESVDESKGAGQRIKELSHQTKVKDEEIRSLQDRIAELTRSTVEDEPYKPNVTPGEEITPERYTQDVTKTADSLVKLHLRQYEAETRIKAETDQIMKDYPQLRPDSGQFDRELSDTITETVEAHLRVNPYSASPKKIVDKLMKPYRTAIEKELGQAQEKIAKQVTSAALRPTSVRKTEKAASEKTIAELEAELGVVIS